MKLKGEMVIELTDTNTGAVETVQETNMITEAVNNILGLNPMGIYLKASGEYDNSVLWNGTLLPICPNMIGGILLFPAVLEEKADHIYEQGKNLPVAYASNNVNSGSNVARGSLNQTESKKLDNGYKFVWEFTPSQGNGNIAAVALTSALGGQNAFGSTAGDASTFLLLKKVDIGDIPKARQMTLFEAVELDFEKNLLYSITFGTSSVTITKIRIPVNIGLNEKLDDTIYTVLEEQTLTTESFTFLGDYTKYGEFMDGHDGYWYGFSNEPNSSGDAKMVWIRISKKDYSFTEGGCDGLLYALIAFVVIDYLTGVMCAFADHTLSSEVGFRGICRKVLIFLLVGMANILDVAVIGNGSVLRTAVIFFYISNEGVSLLENAGHLGLPIPQKMKDVLEQLHDRGEGSDGE